MQIRCVWEHNGEDTLLYAEDYPGAFTRGASLEEALQKMEREIVSYMRWCGQMPQERYEPIVVQEQSSWFSRSPENLQFYWNQIRYPVDVFLDSNRMQLRCEEVENLSVGSKGAGSLAS